MAVRRCLCCRKLEENCWFFVLSIAAWLDAHHTAAANVVIANNGVTMGDVEATIIQGMVLLIAEAAFGAQ